MNTVYSVYSYFGIVAKERSLIIVLFFYYRIFTCKSTPVKRGLDYLWIGWGSMPVTPFLRSLKSQSELGCLTVVTCSLQF